MVPRTPSCSPSVIEVFVNTFSGARMGADIEWKRWRFVCQKTLALENRSCFAGINFGRDRNGVKYATRSAHGRLFPKSPKQFQHLPALTIDFLQNILLPSGRIQLHSLDVCFMRHTGTV